MTIQRFDASALEERIAGIRARQSDSDRRETEDEIGQQSLDVGDLAPDTETLRREHRKDLWRRTVPARFAGAKVSDLDADRAAVIQAWFDVDPPRPNVVLTGKAGTGKTHAVYAIARGLAFTESTPWVVTAAEILDSLRPGALDPEMTMARAKEVPYLVIDDLGAERPTDWTAERFGIVLDHRWREMRATIVTTNLTVGPDAELVEAIGERSYSRLVGSGAVVHAFGGPDLRRVSRETSEGAQS